MMPASLVLKALNPRGHALAECKESLRHLFTVRDGFTAANGVVLGASPSSCCCPAAMLLCTDSLQNAKKHPEGTETPAGAEQPPAQAA